MKQPVVKISRLNTAVYMSTCCTCMSGNGIKKGKPVSKDSLVPVHTITHAHVTQWEYERKNSATLTDVYSSISESLLTGCRSAGHTLDSNRVLSSSVETVALLTWTSWSAFWANLAFRSATMRVRLAIVPAVLPSTTSTVFRVEVVCAVVLQ